MNIKKCSIKVESVSNVRIIILMLLLTPTTQLMQK